MSIGYWIASGLVVLLFIMVTIASKDGWGLTSDEEAKADIRTRHSSVRTGSIHTSRYYFFDGVERGK